MALAVLLLWWVSQITLPALLAQGQSSPATQTQTNAQQSTTTTQAAPSTPAPAKAAAVKPAKKKKSAANCDIKQAAGPAPASSTTANAETAGAAGAQSTSSGNCPPSKKIVRQGGTSEPSIQLAGNSPAPKQPDDITHALTTADDNLKELAGQTLSAKQRDTVEQIHQFQEQSRNALKAGDFDRARTLATKAQTLSEELINPQQ